MDQWQQINGVQRLTRSYLARGRLHAAGMRSSEIDLVITELVHGRVPYRAEGTITRSQWNRLTHPLSDRRLRLVARGGPSTIRSDDVIPDGSRSEGRHRVRFTLAFNDVLNVTRLPRGSFDKVRAHVTFDDLPFCRFAVDHARGVLAGKRIRFRAMNWHFAIAPRLERPEPIPSVDGLLLPGRIEIGLRGAPLDGAVAGSQAVAVDTLSDLADDISAVLSMLALRRAPWLTVSLAKPGRKSDAFVVASRPSWIRAPGSRPGLIFQDYASLAVGAALRSLLRLRAKHPAAADVVRHVMFLFASAVEERNQQQGWYAIAQSIDMLGSVELFRGRSSSEERQDVREQLRDLQRMLRVAENAGIGMQLQQRLKQLRGQIQSPSYLKGIQAVVRHQDVRIADLGGEDLLCDIRDIRNALMHRSSMGENDIAKLLRRGTKRGLSFSTEHLSTDRIALQMMHDRHESALTLLARILLRITGVPERCTRRVWSRGALASVFG